MAKLLALKPTDETVLAMLTHSMKSLDRPLDLVNMYLTAWNLVPKNEELGGQTFFAHVRTSRWAGAHTAARKLYKLAPQERYLWWSIMAACMQAERPNPPAPIPVLLFIPTAAQLQEKDEEAKKTKQGLSKDMLYEIALRLAATTPGGQPSTVERFWLQLYILVKRAETFEATPGKDSKEAWKAAATLVESELGKKAVSASLNCEELARLVATKTGQWDDVYDKTRTQLRNG